MNHKEAWRIPDEPSGRGELILTGLGLIAFWTGVFYAVRAVFA
jgi:hypothetical protein